MTRIAVFGGVYSNPYALAALADDSRARGCDARYCLGDLGGFGAECDAVWPLLEELGATTIAGNYDVAIGRGDEDCGCGYASERDNHFAQLMYDYTREHTSPEFAAWMAELPGELRTTIGGVDVHMVHGSPLAINDFMWESLDDDELALRVRASGARLLLCTHTGIAWQREVQGTLIVNVGAIGRPANDGRREVWYAVVDLDAGEIVGVELVALEYDWRAQAASMRAAGLPEPFVETIETGWWTTCLEIVPPRERARGAFHVYREAMPDGFAIDGAGWAEAPAPAGDDRPVVSLFGTALFPPRLWVYTNFHCNLACDYCVVASSPRRPQARAFSAAPARARRRGAGGGLRGALPHRRRAVRAPRDRRRRRVRERSHDDGRPDERDALHRPAARGARAARGPRAADAAVLDRRRARRDARPLARRRVVGEGDGGAALRGGPRRARCASR